MGGFPRFGKGCGTVKENCLAGPSTVISVIMPPPLDVKGGIITEKIFPVFSESFFWTCFGLVMYIWELMGVTEKFAFQM